MTATTTQKALDILHNIVFPAGGFQAAMVAHPEIADDISLCQVLFESRMI